jgi:hypothetical protein
MSKYGITISQSSVQVRLDLLTFGWTEYKENVQNYIAVVDIDNSSSDSQDQKEVLQRAQFILVVERGKLKPKA